METTKTGRSTDIETPRCHRHVEGFGSGQQGKPKKSGTKAEVKKDLIAPIVLTMIVPKAKWTLLCNGVHGESPKRSTKERGYFPRYLTMLNKSSIGNESQGSSDNEPRTCLDKG